MDKNMKKCLNWIMLVSASPIAFLVLLLMTLFDLLRFLWKAALLFIIVAINTPFAVMCNMSAYVLLIRGSLAQNTSATGRKPSNPRFSLGIEVQVIVSDFLKVVIGELLIVFSTGIITFYTAPRLVFYISTGVWLVALLHKWLNTDSLSKTALSCLIDGYGLNPLMILFSFIGLFDIGCHPVAKCAFDASKAFLFVKDGLNQFNDEDGQNLDHERKPINKCNTRLVNREKDFDESDIEQGHNKCNAEVVWHRFNGAQINTKQLQIDFLLWNAFERGLFQLNPRIDFNGGGEHGKYFLESFMVLKLRGNFICEYPMEVLELREDYSKANELYNFLVTLSLANSFVTDKMGGRYQHSLTLLEIAEGVEENDGYKIIKAKDLLFVVAIPSKKSERA